MTDKYTKAALIIEGALSEFFGGLTHRFVVVGTGIDEQGRLVEKVIVPDGQLYSDTVGQIAYAKMVMDVEMRAHYLGQKWMQIQEEDDGSGDE